MSTVTYTSGEQDGTQYTSKDVVARIRKLRKNKKMSMYMLALNAGLNNTVIQRVERGEREPRIGTLFKIIDGLEMSPAEFFRDFAEY
ncbi:MAG: helix-turn-helix domain-containing protein [Candidatus Margulisbacteria bacterium]|jgi:transcriptional regulator with XRE-family HTH domain|nr:helix-turn-helix domain-containing protein [Candidatus Margulisiibacteriota bacterium]